MKYLKARNNNDFRITLFLQPINQTLNAALQKVESFHRKDDILTAFQLIFPTTILFMGQGVCDVWTLFVRWLRLGQNVGWVMQIKWINLPTLLMRRIFMDRQLLLQIVYASLSEVSWKYPKLKAASIHLKISKTQVAWVELRALVALYQVLLKNLSLDIQFNF